MTKDRCSACGMPVDSTRAYFEPCYRAARIEIDDLRDRLEKMETFLSSAVMVGGRLTVERDRYRKALEQIIRTCTTVHTGSAFAIADEALDYDLPQEDA